MSLVYPENFEEKIGFDRIREILRGFCLGDPASLLVGSMAFMTDSDSVLREVSTVTELQSVLPEHPQYPLDHYHDLGPVLKRTAIEGTFIEVDELVKLRDSLSTIRALYQLFMGLDSDLFPRLTTLAAPVKIHPFVTGSIDNILSPKGEIRDKASAELYQIRKELHDRRGQVNNRIHQILKQLQHSGMVEKDAALAVRNGRLVIPVSAGQKRKIHGLVHDESATGKTVFIEPAEVVELNNQILELEYAEKREIIRILRRFTDALRPYLTDLGLACDFLAYTDFTRARVLLADSLQAVKPVLTSEGMSWEGAVHPLLYLNFRKEGKKVVPLDISLDEKRRILLISGPNAGGKSVCLKTLGLLQYMFQCGLPVPLREGSKMCLFSHIFIDMGDDQSIENDLSTYSSHLLHMKYFVKHAGPSTLVLIDEFGSGTEPQLGGAIAEAILLHLSLNGCYGVITTHYTNLKHFASSAEGVENGAMLFDTQMMQPLFRLETGRPGSSFAFEIARRIGLPENILANASEKVGKDHVEFDRHLKDLVRDKRYIERKRQKIRQVEKELENTLSKYLEELETTQDKRKQIIEAAKKQAADLLSGVNSTIENTIRVIRESQAEKQATREARNELDKVRTRVGETDQEADDPGMKRIGTLKRELHTLREKDEDAKETAGERKPARKTVIETGDFVRMKGQDTVGQVIGTGARNILVSFGHMITSLEPSRLEKLGEDEVKKLDLKTRKSGFGYDLREKKLHFRSEIDIRGYRAEEAVRIITEYLDEAVMVSAAEVRILHGKGDGILRQVVREYLSAQSIVRSFRDEHPERGGSGVTLVQLDL